MTDLEICYLSATEVLARFKAQSLTPVDYLEVLIRRTDAVNPIINAYSETFFDQARLAAIKATAVYADPMQTPRALEGLPVAVKDAQRVAGQRTTQGSLILKDHIDTTSDPMIDRILAAGAIIHARTTTPEFCLSGSCNSRLWGKTLNPFNTDFGPGGSSGGSAAALAAGMTPLATGTDIGGSIRIPASCCGLVGFKPPHGRNPDGPPANFDRYNHCGFLARNVDDAALGQNVVSGPHPLDHDSLRDRVVIPAKFPKRPLRVAWSMDLGYMPIEPDVRENTRAALAALERTGCTVQQVDLGWDRSVDTAALQWYAAMHFGRAPFWAAQEHRDLLTDYALAAADAAAALQPDDVARSWEVQHRMYQSLGPVFEEFDVFLCPTLAIGAIRADHNCVGQDFTVAGQKVDAEFGWVLTHQFNMLSNCPVMSLPSGRDRFGIPTGVQLVGPTFDDLAVFRAAKIFETAMADQFLPKAALPGFSART